MNSSLKYLSNYPEHLRDNIEKMLQENKLKGYLLSRYPDVHNVTNDSALRDFVMRYKNQYVKQSSPISQIKFDPKIHVIKNALGTHTFVSRVQGSKLKSKNEIRVSTLFKKGPEAFLQMIVVHELAHVKEKDHNKAFYQLCRHMLPEYHQVEFDVRVYLTYVDVTGDDLY